ncbi:hypothetical protein NsoK4_01110 [Nitrosopumilus sp. K4]|uniref:hypothetical protein n=1 Tax=Nitrosopumilus sp. K4 TaxID=2795383 RepID=UPI001BA4B34E|nr:hypothetical protein [Nitrosopumilus sp. K4]QUC64911.1 hypothetical protein NsoK4_01110 [Nitrosopumilus sp. K4]
MDRIKRLSYEVLDKHQSKFGEDFADNKKILDQISIIRSKGLKNEVAGYITKYVKKQIREEKIKQAQREEAIKQETAYEVEPEVEETNITKSEDVVESTEAAAEPEPSESEEKSE